MPSAISRLRWISRWSCGTWLAVASLAHGQTEAGDTVFRPIPDAAFLGSRYVARSTAIGDVDNDGWADVVVAPNSDFRKVTVWRNEAGRRFSPEPELTMPAITGGGTILGDYDNDGDLDVYVALGAYLASSASRNPLLRNDEGAFADVGVEAGLEAQLSTDNAIWLDYDSDGHLDLYVADMGCCSNSEAGFDPSRRNRLFRNRGDGTFEDVTAAVRLDLSLDPNQGGSNGGMAAADFSGDGRVDLYVGVYTHPNRLFLQGADGTFADRTTGDIADPGMAFGVAVGDLNGDGLPDIVQAGGGDLEGVAYHTPVLLSLGRGAFVDVAEGSGLGALSTVNILGVGLGDVDNDGDLDLLTAWPHYLFLNDGAGSFTDATAQSGILPESQPALTVSFGDLDNDGFLDVVSGGIGRGWLAFLNNGNTNHWLRVQLEGVRSNRQGIGARVVGRSGQLRQTREVLGGLGYYQDEAVAHLGLGAYNRVDSLYVHWPSGVSDTLLAVAADQKVRVVEGSGRAVAVGAWRWEDAPDTLVAGGEPFYAVVHPVLPEPGESVPEVTAEFEDAEGSTAVAVAARDDGSYRIGPVAGSRVAGTPRLRVHVRQETDRGVLWSQSGWTTVFLPGGDFVLYGEESATQPDISGSFQAVELAATPPAGRTGSALAVSVQRQSSAWNVVLRPAEALPLFGYTTLRFWFHPGTAQLPEQPNFRLTARLLPLDLLAQGRVDLTARSWQLVEIPLAEFGTLSSLVSLLFWGNFGGTFYLDDIRIVAAKVPAPITAVVEARTQATPEGFTLEQNYPNPFNSTTVIPFALPRPADTELSIYDLLGQRVVTLASGHRDAGRYQLRWDGHDDAGRALASGVYLYQLRAGDWRQTQTQRLLLLR